jgi:hypothetical protein
LPAGQVASTQQDVSTGPFGPQPMHTNATIYAHLTMSLTLSVGMEGVVELIFAPPVRDTGGPWLPKGTKKKGRHAKSSSTNLMKRKLLKGQGLWKGKEVPMQVSLAVTAPGDALPRPGAYLKASALKHQGAIFTLVCLMPHTPRAMICWHAANTMRLMKPVRCPARRAL